MNHKCTHVFFKVRPQKGALKSNEQNTELKNFRIDDILIIRISLSSSMRYFGHGIREKKKWVHRWFRKKSMEEEAAVVYRLDSVVRSNLQKKRPCCLEQYIMHGTVITGAV